MLPTLIIPDVWLYSQLDETGTESELWTKVDAVEGNNVIYNSPNKKNKKHIQCAIPMQMTELV